MRDVILFILPQTPDPQQREAHWWRVTAGEIVESGTGNGWLDHASNEPANGRVTIGITPAASVRLSFADLPPAGANPRQAAALARIAARETSLGDPETLHTVSSRLEGEASGMLTAIVDNGTMIAWLDWARAVGVELHHVVPAAALFRWDEQWTEAKVGNETLLGRRGTVLPSEPALAALVVGDAEVRPIDGEETGRALVEAAVAPPLDLRSGRFARRRRIAIDRARIRELAILAALIPLMMLLLAVASIVRLDRSTARIDAQTLAIAEAALGRGVTLETAETELRQRAGSRGQGFSAPLAAFFQRLDSVPAITATELSYRPDGTLVATLAAASIDPINALLIQIQRDGYRVTAVPRQAPDGRATVDLTVRSDA